ncbi:hypothetical protein [Sphingopyxis sp.]|uniref:caspase family protein n=1 Tax=Sphingopyxis sp. TaxID=1908224 RepID=UPI002B47518C|nr:hypothetical protein [Sphingopyxis sp.]HJS13160.1 hypothetical protein [Sphingopyxis sp.]
MSSRALLAIGCDRYDHLAPLLGAEADASGIFDLLIAPQVGDYDVGNSQLLRSPTLGEVREALTSTLFTGETLDTLTVVFAGHGAVGSGSFYMAMRDSRADALSATALSLADLFRMISEAAPRQTYIVIDACQSGGLISDLNVILKSEVMGEFGTPGVSLLATSASDQSAIEIDGRGVGTTALMECIRGDMFLQDTSATLDLVEIGRAVSQRVSAAGEQTPVVWGLNLYGPAGFCKNPHAGTGDAPLRSVQAGWPDAKIGSSIREGLPKLWAPYVTISNRWDAREFVDRLGAILEELKGEPEAQVIFAQRMAQACAVQAQQSADRGREIEVRAACAVALLPWSREAAVADHLSAACSGIASLVETMIADAVAALDNYRFSLVTGGLNELYHLPIRISQLLGWAGFAIHTRLWNGEDSSAAAARFTSLLSRIFETYSLSLVAMSDAQSPAVMSTISAMSRIGLRDQGEQLLGHLFSSSIANKGKVALAHLEPDQILGYLIARAAQPGGVRAKFIARPTELMLALLRAAPHFDLADEFDAALEQVDHLALNAYLPENFQEFGDAIIRGGKNAVFQIGHDVWSVADIEAAWPGNPAPDGPGVAMTALAASLLFPDRTPWFLLPLRQTIEGKASLFEGALPDGS